MAVPTNPTPQFWYSILWKNVGFFRDTLADVTDWTLRSILFPLSDEFSERSGIARETRESRSDSLFVEATNDPWSKDIISSSESSYRRLSKCQRVHFVFPRRFGARPEAAILESLS